MQNIVDDLKALDRSVPVKSKFNPWLYVAGALFLVLVAGGSLAAVRLLGVSVSAMDTSAPATQNNAAAPSTGVQSGTQGHAQNSSKVEPTAQAPAAVDTSNAINAGAVAIPLASDEYKQVIAAQADHSPRGNPNQGVVTGAEVVVDTSADVQPEAPAASEVAPVVEAVAVPVPTASQAIQAIYTSRTQDRCSMPRANPATCKQPIPAMSAPVGNTP